MKHKNEKTNLNDLTQINRRDFLFGVGIVGAGISVPQLASAHIGDPFPRKPVRYEVPYIVEREDGEYLIIASSVGLVGHWHNLEIPMNVINYPGDAEFRTTVGGFHSHPVVLTAADLEDVRRGGQINIKDGSWEEHSFTIYLPNKN